MCDEQKASGSFRETADRVMGEAQQSAPNAYPAGVGQLGVGQQTYEYRRQLSRIKHLEERALSDERLFQTFAKLAQKGSVSSLTLVVFDPQGLHPGSSTTIMSEYGPYNLLELLQKYNELREFKHWHVRVREGSLGNTVGYNIPEQGTRSNKY